MRGKIKEHLFIKVTVYLPFCDKWTAIFLQARLYTR